MKNKFVEAIKDAIEQMDSRGLFELNNRYCESADYLDNFICENDDSFFQLFSDVEHFAKVVSGNYYYYHRYVIFNGYGNLESFDRVTIGDLVDYPATMAEYIAENWHEFSDLFDIEEEEEEEAGNA